MKTFLFYFIKVSICSLPILFTTLIIPINEGMIDSECGKVVKVVLNVGPPKDLGTIVHPNIIHSSTIH